MSTERVADLDEQTREALDELKGLIAGRFPQASFEVAHGDDPEGTYLKATVDTEDVDDVLDVVLDRLFAIQVERGLPVYVIPLEPVERVLKKLRRPRWSARLALDWNAPIHRPKTA